MSLSPEQLEQRAGRIGSSSIAAIAGLSPYSTAIGEWLKITGRVQFEPSDATELGHACEEGIGLRAAVKLGLGAVERNHGDNARSYLYDDFAIATPDFDVWSGDYKDVPDAVLECKNVSIRVMDHWDGDDPSGYPDYVYGQVQHQLHALGRKRAYVGAAVAGLGPYVYVVDYDEKFAGEMMEIARRFHRDHIVTGVAPDRDHSKSTAEYLRVTYPKNVRELVTATPEIEVTIAELKELRAQMLRLDREVALRTHQVCDFVGDADGVESRCGTITWKQQAGRVRSSQVIDALWDRSPVSRTELDALKDSNRGEPFRSFLVPRAWKKEAA